MTMIEVFTTKTCVYCPSLKRYLDSLNVEYQQTDVTDDREQQQRLYKLTGAMTVPVTLFDNGKYVVGLNYGKLKELI